MHTGTKRSKSRALMRARDANPEGLPRVRFNHMSHEDDWLKFRACIYHARETFAQAARAP